MSQRPTPTAIPYNGNNDDGNEETNTEIPLVPCVIVDDDYTEGQQEPPNDNTEEDAEVDEERANNPPDDTEQVTGRGTAEGALPSELDPDSQLSYKDQGRDLSSIAMQAQRQNVDSLPSELDPNSQLSYKDQGRDLESVAMEGQKQLQDEENDEESPLPPDLTYKDLGRDLASVLNQRGDEVAHTEPLSAPEQHSESSQPSEREPNHIDKAKADPTTTLRRKRLALMIPLLLVVSTVIVIVTRREKRSPNDSPATLPVSAPTIPAPTPAPTLAGFWGQVGQDVFFRSVTSRPTSAPTVYRAFSTVSLAIDAFGRRVAIGAPGDGGVGRVYTYELKDEWTMLGSEDGLRGDQIGCEFGNSTDLSDDGMHLAVGARNHSNGRGKASVFSLSNGSWKLQGQALYGQFVNDNFGNAVSISANGKRMAVSAARQDVNGFEDNGAVKVFEYDGDAGNWKQLGQTLSGEEAHEQFGFSIKLAGSGDVLAVGAPFRHQSGEKGRFEWGGAVMAYKFDGNKWIKLGQTIKHNNPVEQFGWSVDASVRGYVIAAGAPVNDENGEASGQVRVYEYNSTKQDWQLRGDPIQGQDLGSWFGHTVSLSSDGLKLVSAAWCDRIDVAQCDFGSRMYIYIPQTRKWQQFGDDLPGKTRSDPYSTSVAMAKDATVVVSTVDLQSGQAVIQTYRPDY